MDAYSRFAQKRIALDLDGTIASHVDFKKLVPIGEPIDGSHEFVKRLQRMGEVFIHSGRAVDREAVRTIEQWLRTNGFGIAKVLGKPRAIAYIDNRGVHFGGDYDAVLAAVEGLSK
jgi:predicted phosphatase